MEYVTEMPTQGSVLAKLSESERKMLQQFAVQKEYKKGEFVAHYGDIWPYVAIVNSGMINVVKLSAEGRRLGGLKLRSGDEFWGPSLFDGEPLPAALEVGQAGTVVTIWHRNHVLPIVQKNPVILWELCLLLMKRMRQASGFVEGLTFHPVAGRLAQLLLKQFEGSTSDLVTRELSLDEMGTIIGTTSVMVCKQLYRFAEDGMINVSRTEFQLTDQAGLEKVAGVR